MTQKLNPAFIKNSLIQSVAQKLSALTKMWKAFAKENKEAMEEYAKTIPPRYWRPHNY